LFRKLFNFARANPRYGLEVRIKSLSSGEAPGRGDLDEVEQFYHRQMGLMAAGEDGEEPAGEAAAVHGQIMYNERYSNMGGQSQNLE
jgi:hypothetical protein